MKKKENLTLNLKWLYSFKGLKGETLLENFAVNT